MAYNSQLPEGAVTNGINASLAGVKKVLFVSGSGGHSKQMEILLKQLGHKYHSELMLEYNDSISLEKFKNDYKIYTAIPIRGKKENTLKTFLRILINSIQSVTIYFISRPQFIITTGPGLGVPICILAKNFGAKIIVIESWSRTQSKSIVGQLLYGIADLFFVQWPEMTKLYANAKYAGRFI